MITKGIFSKLSDDWATPSGIYKKLNTEFAFTYDPCQLQSNDMTSLLREWSGSVFINPPYSNIMPFIEKALIELRHKRITVAVFLLPARTDRAWFLDYCLKYGEVRFIRGRLKFGDSKFNAPFPSMVVIFRRRAEAMHKVSEYRIVNTKHRITGGDVI